MEVFDNGKREAQDHQIQNDAHSGDSKRKISIIVSKVRHQRVPCSRNRVRTEELHLFQCIESKYQLKINRSFITHNGGRDGPSDQDPYHYFDAKPKDWRSKEPIIE